MSAIMRFLIALALLIPGIAWAQPVVSVPVSVSGCAIAGCTFTGGVTFNSTISTPAGAIQYGAYLSNAGAPTAGGSGYAVGNQITLTGGTSSVPVIVNVDAVSSTVVTEYHVIQQGVFTIPPAGAMTQASVSAGSGTGATFTLSFGPLAANVLFPPFVSGGVNGDTVLGNQAGLNRSVATIGNTIYGDRAGGGGANTGDGMGGGTGLTNGEGTFNGQWAGTQCTTCNAVWMSGMNVGGHEVAGLKEMLGGTDTGKWLYNGNRVTALGGWNTATYLQNPQLVTIVGSNNTPGQIIAATITGAADNGSGAIRLAVNSSTGMATNDAMVVTGVGGTTEANAYWTGITVIDGTHVDLIGSTFTHAYTSGGSSNTFTTFALNSVTSLGENNLTGAALRSTGSITLVGVGNGNAVTTAKQFGGLGNGILTALVNGVQNWAFADGACSTVVAGNGNTCLGFNSNVSASGNNNATALGGAGNGGGTGAIAGDSGVTVGARSGKAGMGGSLVIAGVQIGNDCSSTNNTGIMIGTLNNVGCGTSTAFTNFFVLSDEGSIVPAASHTMNLNGMWLASGTGTPATATTTLHGSTMIMPDIANATTAQTGTLCWTVGGVTYDNTNTCLVSSARFKHDVQPITGALAKIDAMRPVSFLYNGDNDNGPHFGLIAEEVAKIDGRLVANDNDGRPLKVKYIDAISVLIGAVQEQQREIGELRRAAAR